MTVFEVSSFLRRVGDPTGFLGKDGLDCDGAFKRSGVPTGFLGIDMLRRASDIDVD